jgi:chorismate-pyruvate lyase
MRIFDYYATALPFAFSVESGWWEIAQFHARCQSHPMEPPVEPIVRMVLSSNGSLVKHVSAYHLSPVTLHVTRQEEAFLDGDMGKFLDLPEGRTTLVRDVWMSWNGPNTEGVGVFAHSVIDGVSLSPSLAQGVAGGKVPVGILLEEFQVPVLRDRMYVGYLRSPELAVMLNSAETRFWARCFRLRGGEGFCGAILEVLFPGIFR